MSRNIGVATIQMEVSLGDGNINSMETYLERIRDQDPWVDLVVFSELCVFGHEEKYAEKIPGKTTDSLCSLAKKYGFWLVPGSLFELTGEGNYNTAIAINPEGEIVGKHRKLYPWRPLEKAVAGSDFCVFDIPGIARVGICICYDQWFPEVSRQLTWMGAEVILCPTMTTTADRPLELILAQANAIANQVYFVDLNGVGQGGNGQSIIIDAEGQILARAEADPAILTTQMDLDRLWEIREKGTFGTCQVLKSFRDGNIRFPVYQGDTSDGEGLQPLGPIRVRPSKV